MPNARVPAQLRGGSVGWVGRLRRHRRIAAALRWRRDAGAQARYAAPAGGRRHGLFAARAAARVRGAAMRRRRVPRDGVGRVAAVRLELWPRDAGEPYARFACFRARRMRSHVHASSFPLPSNPASLPSPRNARSLGPRAPRARWHLGRVPPAHRAARVRGHGVCRALHRVRLVLLDRVSRQLHPGGCRAGQQQQQQQQQRRGFAWRRARLLADARALHRDGRGARGRGVPAAAGEEGLRADPVP